MKTYLRHKILNVVDVKELIALEYLDFEGKYKDYAENHDFWEVCYVECGEIVLALEDEKQKLTSGQIMVITPGKKHSYYSESGNRSKVFVICFESFSHTLKPLGEMLFSLKEEQQDCIQKIISECFKTFRMNEDDHLEVVSSPNFGGQQAILLQLEYLLICLLRQLSTEEHSGIVFLSEEKFYSDLVDVVKDFFTKNIGKKLTLNDICGKFNYSRSFICKTFKEQTGETLFTCFNRMKIEEAKRLLKHTDLSPARIAESLGFKEVKYFDAIFKKQLGVSPTTYRKQNKIINKRRDFNELS